MSFAAKKKLKPSADASLAETLDLYLAKLGISAAALANAAPLTGILAEAEGGIPAILETMRLARDVPIIGQFLETYEAQTVKDRELVPLEGFAILAGVGIPEILGEILLALQRSSANMVKLIALSNHPNLVRRRVEYAMLPEGVKDRDAIDKALRFLPTPKGTTIVLPPELHPAVAGVSPDDVDTDQIFPDLKDTQRLLTDGDQE